jgi:hypothetical protein
MAAVGKVKKARKYKKASCHTTVTAAKSAAKKLRTEGMTASVRGKCVWSAGKSKGIFGRKK